MMDYNQKVSILYKLMDLIISRVGKRVVSMPIGNLDSKAMIICDFDSVNNYKLELIRFILKAKNVDFNDIYITSLNKVSIEDVDLTEFNKKVILKEIAIINPSVIVDTTGTLNLSGDFKYISITNDKFISTCSLYKKSQKEMLTDSETSMYTEAKNFFWKEFVPFFKFYGEAVSEHE